MSSPNSITVGVSGMTCGSCVSTVTKALENLGLDVQATVSLASGTAHVTGPASVTYDAVTEAIEACGFTAGPCGSAGGASGGKCSAGGKCKLRHIVEKDTFSPERSFGVLIRPSHSQANHNSILLEIFPPLITTVQQAPAATIASAAIPAAVPTVPAPAAKLLTVPLVPPRPRELVRVARSARVDPIVPALDAPVTNPLRTRLADAVLVESVSMLLERELCE